MLDEQLIQRGMELPLGSGMTHYLETAKVSGKVNRSEVERELRRFLIMCAAQSDVAYAVVGPVDRAWHTFILFTRDYASFCEALAGRFIHHAPASGCDRTAAVEAYVQLHRDYERFFGEPPPSNVWPQIEKPVSVFMKMVLEDGTEFCMDEPEAGGSIRA